MFARRVEIGSTVIGRVESKNAFAPMSCSELDDLLDEILGDQIFHNNNNNVPSHKPPESTTRQRNGQPTCNAVQQNNVVTPRATAAATATTSSESTATPNEKDTKAPVKNQADDATKCNTEPYPVMVVGGSSVENCAEIQTGGGSRGRAPSLPVNCSPANRYRRLQSVPCNDYFGGTHSIGSQSFYDRSDQFLHGLCSDEPVAWLDRQKMKLQSRNESRWRSNQSDQQRRLVEELKAAQTMLGFQRQTTQRRDVPDGESGANIASQKSQTLGHRREHGSTTGGGVLVQMSDQLQGLDLLQPYVNDATRNDAMGNDAMRSDVIRSDVIRSDVIRSDAASCKSERSYYVSGVEMPPFTTHQTKYVFSVSSPHSSSSSHVNPSDVITQKVQHHDHQTVNARPGPPTPKRVSSRDALRHSFVHDWKLEQWEQESYTSLSSKSDVPETSVAADKRNGAVDTRQPTFNSAQSVDQTGIYDALDVSKARFHGTNNPAMSYRGLQGECVESTPLNSNTGPMTAANGAVVQISGSNDTVLNGSSTSGTSSLSINSTSHQSAFEPLLQCSSDGQHQGNYFADSANLSSSSKLEPISASMVVKSPKSSSFHPTTDNMHHSVSDFALLGRDSFSRNSHNPTETGSTVYRGAPLVNEINHSRVPTSSSSFPTDVLFPTASSAKSLVSTMSPEKSSSLKKYEDSHGQAINSSGTRHLAIPAEQQPLGSDGMEVISLQLIGPGMQKLEPEGDLPAVRPVTPKFAQPGIGMGASNSLISRPKSLGNHRHSPSEENPRPHPGSVVHQKFDPGPRRATIYDHTLVAVDSGREQDSCNGQSRTELADVLDGEDQTKQKMKHRRHTTASGHDLLLRPTPQHRRPFASSEGASSSSETAFRRTERLLSADFTTAQGRSLLDRRGSASPSAGDRSTTGRRRGSSQLLLGPEDRDTSDATDDVFASAKPGTTGRRNSKALGQRETEREVNLAMLDNAVAGLRASASSPVDGSSSSNTVVQLPPPGKATPGSHPARDPLSPRASIHTLSNGAMTSSSSNNSTDTTIRTNHAPRFVRDSSRNWHKPNISRDEAISSLKDTAPGTFLIRNSNSFPGAFGLALKVAHLPPNVHSRGGDPKAELVRHFLIEPTAKGVKLKGCNSEPVFGSLAALVYQHSLTALSLPCKLIVPDPSSARKRDETAAKSDVTTSETLLLGATCNVLYINSVDMESLTGNEAIEKAVAATFATAPLPLTTIVQLKVSSQGVTLTDVNRKLFFRRHYPVDTVTFAGIDPEMRSWVWTNDETKSAHKSNVFGFVARKQGSPMDNACHVFAELDRDQPGDAIVDFIMKVMLGQR